jgi:hypothetical protein
VFAIIWMIVFSGEPGTSLLCLLAFLLFIH